MWHIWCIDNSKEDAFHLIAQLDLPYSLGQTCVFGITFRFLLL